MPLIPENTIEYIKSQWRRLLPTDMSGKGVVCPICGNGASGGDGDGLKETNVPNVLKCFKCNFAGDVISFIQQANNWSFSETVKYCADHLGISIDDADKNQKYLPPQTHKTPIKEDKPEIDLSAFFADSQSHLQDTDYWKRRGLSLETCQHFKLGYVEKWINPVGNYKVPSPRLIIPTSQFSYLARDVRDDLKGIAAKYAKLKVSHIRLFNTAAIDHEIVFITEGEFDAMSIYEVGEQAIALGGVSNKSKLIDMLKTANKVKVKAFILSLDNDDAGSTTSQWLHHQLSDLGYIAIEFNISGKHKDANEALMADRSAFENNIRRAKADIIKLLSKNKLLDISPPVHKEPPSDLAKKAAQLADITKSLNQSNIIKLAMIPETLKLADAIHNTEFDADFLEFRRKVVKVYKIVTSKEFDEKLAIAAGRRRKVETGALVNARTTKSTFEDCPIDLIVPNDFFFEKNGIFNHKMEVASHTPIVISRIFKNLDESHSQKYEAYYLDGKTNEWRKIIADKSCFSDAHKIVSLADSGLDITTFSAKLLIPYISALVSCNKDTIPVVYSYTQPGWRDNFTKFIFPPSGEDYVMDNGDFDFERAFTIKGDAEKWLDFYNEAIKNKFARLILGISLAAPVAEVFHLRNMMAHLFGRSGGGKTAILKLAASIYADPKYFMQNFNSTHNFIMHIAALMNNLPFFINELQSANNKGQMENLKGLPFRLEEGKDKGRLSKEAKARRIYYFSLLAITTGENPFTCESSEMGAKARVLEFGDKEILPDEFAQQVHRFLQEGNHGHYGRKWIEFIKDDIQGKQQVRRVYEEMFKEEKVKKAYKEKIAAHINLIQSALTCNLFFQLLFCDISFDEALQQARDCALALAEELQDKNELTDTQRAWRSIQDIIGSRYKHFKINNMEENEVMTPMYGVIRTTNGNDYTAIRAKILREELEKEGYNALKITKELANEGYLERGVGRDLTHKIRGEVGRFFKLSNIKLNEQ